MPLLPSEHPRSLTRLTRRLAVLGTAAGLLVTLAPAATAASTADSTTDLGVSLTYESHRSHSGDVAVGAGKIFISVEDQILVADTGGALTGAITGLSKPQGLATTSDGSHLYAALHGSGQVAEIDTGTLQIVRRIDLPAHRCPSSLALSGERLWVGHGCGTDLEAGVIGLDVSAPAPEPVVVEGHLSYAPLVAAAGDTLVVGDTGLTPADQRVYDVSGTPTLRGEIDGFTYATGFLQDLAITPDGSNVISAFDLVHFDRWDTTSLTRVRTYGEDVTDSDGYPASVAISPDGSYVAGGRRWGTDLAVYDAATGTKTFAEDNLAGFLVPGSLAFSGEGVFGLLTAYETNRLHLWRLPRMTLPSPGLTLTAPSGATAEQPLTLTGRLTLPGGSAPCAQPLTVNRRLPDGTSTTLASVTTAPDGTFAVTDTPPVGGPITYSVTWNGTDDVRWSRASVTATVRHQSFLTLTGPVGGVVGTALTLKGRLKVADVKVPPADALLTVERTVTGDSGTVTTTLPAVRPERTGAYTFTDTPAEAGWYTYTVQWAGNDKYGPSKATYQVEVVQAPNG